MDIASATDEELVEEALRRARTPDEPIQHAPLGRELVRRGLATDGPDGLLLDGEDEP